MKPLWSPPGVLLELNCGSQSVQFHKEKAAWQFLFLFVSSSLPAHMRGTERPGSQEEAKLTPNFLIGVGPY